MHGQVQQQLDKNLNWIRVWQKQQQLQQQPKTTSVSSIKPSVIQKCIHIQSCIQCNAYWIYWTCRAYYEWLWMRVWVWVYLNKSPMFTECSAHMQFVSLRYCVLVMSKISYNKKNVVKYLHFERGNETKGKERRGIGRRMLVDATYCVRQCCCCLFNQ